MIILYDLINCHSITYNNANKTPNNKKFLIIEYKLRNIISIKLDIYFIYFRN